MRERLRACGLLLICGGLLSVFPRESGGGMGVGPGKLGLPLVDNVYNLNGIAGNGASATCVACHSTVPVAGRTTHFVSHYSASDGANRTTSAADKAAKERTSAWTGSARSAKYGQNIAAMPASDNTTTGELICESCHNIVYNVAGGNNLLESSLPADPRPVRPNTLTSPTTTLCEGCHVTETLPGHHPMTGDTVSTTGQLLSNADTGFSRGYVSAAEEVGAPGMPIPPGSEVKYPSANAVSCVSCHGNGHTGFFATGARILRRGYSQDPNAGSPKPGVTGVDSSGIDRQFDVGAVRLITNYTPLCDSCHKSND